MKEPTPKDKKKPESPEVKLLKHLNGLPKKPEPTKEETPKESPLDFIAILEAANKAAPKLSDMLEMGKKDPSTMCEFTIKGNENFVINCLSLVLG